MKSKVVKSKGDFKWIAVPKQFAFKVKTEASSRGYPTQAAYLRSLSEDDVYLYDHFKNKEKKKRGGKFELSF